MAPSHFFFFFWNFIKQKRGTPRNDAKAVEYFSKAATEGFTSAQVALGRCYLDGAGVEKNSQKAMEWFEVAASKNDPEAYFQLYHVFRVDQQDLKKAAQYLLKSAEMGYSEAQFELGVNYHSGSDMIERNYNEATKWFEKAAQHGDVDAMFNLGLCYLEGMGVEKNLKKAFEWFEKGWADGDVSCGYNLGLCYLEGTGLF